MDYCFLSDDDVTKYNRPIPSDKDAFIQMAEGLDYIHSNKLVHRDVKPSNILISTNSTTGLVLLKWSDFGLCRHVSERGTYTPSGIKGTEKWLAPEILIMRNEYLSGHNTKRGTIKSDTFAAGAVFFYLLSGGNHPFGKDIDIVLNIRNGKSVNMKGNFLSNQIEKISGPFFTQVEIF